MFNLVMGIIMVAGGCISLAWGIIDGARPFPVCIGCTLLVFGIVEIIRSKSIRERSKRRKENEMDVYLRLASEMGVVVNPITKEVISKNKDQQEMADGQDESDVKNESVNALTDDKSEEQINLPNDEASEEQIKTQTGEIS